MKIDKPRHAWQLTFEGEWPTSVAFVGSSNRIAAGNRAGQIFVWDLPGQPPASAGKKQDSNKKSNKSDSKTAPDLAPKRHLDGHANAITHLRVTPDGKTLISASLDHSVRLWDVAAPSTGKAEVVLDSKSRERAARYKRGDDKAKILDAPGVPVDTITAKRVLEGHKGWVFALDVSADGKRLVSGDDSCLSVVWDMASGNQVSRWKGYDRVWVRSAALSPDGKTVFTCEFADRRSSFDAPAAQVRLWNADDGSLKLDLLKTWTPDVKDKDRVDSYGYMQKWRKLLKRGLVCAAFSPGGKLLAAGQGGETDTGKVHLIDVASGKILRTVSGHRYGVCDVAFSADGKYVISSGRDTMVRICQVSDGKEVAALGKSRGGQFKDWMHAVSISPDQTSIAAADIAGIVHVWKIS